MKKFLAIPVLLAFSLMGCGGAYQTAQQFQTVIAGILNIAQGGVSSLPAADQATVGNWVNAALNLDGQLAGCINSAGTSAAASAFGTCFDTFAAGLTSPSELAQLRIVSAASQKKVELWATAAILAVNGALAIYNLAAQPQPTIAQAPSRAELLVVASEVNISGRELRAEGF